MTAATAARARSAGSRRVQRRPEACAAAPQGGDLGHLQRRPVAPHQLQPDLVAHHVLQPAGRVAGDDPAPVDHRDPVEHALGLQHVVRHQHHRGAALGPSPVHRGPHRAPRDRVHAGGRLVQHQQRPLADQRGRRSRPAGAVRRTASSAAARRCPRGPARRSRRPARRAPRGRRGRAAGRWSPRPARPSARPARWTPDPGSRAAGRPAPGGAPGRGRARETLPESGRSSPVSWRTRVDLPAPLGPSSPKISPRCTSRVMPSLARTAGARAAPRRPRIAGYVLTRSCTAHTGTAALHLFCARPHEL